jgi:hypothetical protein
MHFWGDEFINRLAIHFHVQCIRHPHRRVQCSHAPKVTMHNLLQPKILEPAFGEAPDDISCRIGQDCDDFKGRQKLFRRSPKSGAVCVPFGVVRPAQPCPRGKQYQCSYSKNLLHGRVAILRDAPLCCAPQRAALQRRAIFANTVDLSRLTSGECISTAMTIPRH